MILTNYNTDLIIEKLIDEEISSNFSDFLGIGERGRAIKEAKLYLKDKLQAKYGKGWWLPGKINKYRKEYKMLVGDAVTAAVDEVKTKKFEQREEKRKVKAERKDERSVNQEKTQFETQLEQQQIINQINAENAKNEKPVIHIEPPASSKKSRTGMFIGLGAGLLLIIIVIVIIVKKKNA